MIAGLSAAIAALSNGKLDAFLAVVPLQMTPLVFFLLMHVKRFAAVLTPGIGPSAAEAAEAAIVM